MADVPGFPAVVPDTGKDECLAFSRPADAVFTEVGAPNVIDCWGGDMPDGTMTSMPMMGKCGPDGMAALSWIVWPTRKLRHSAMPNVMEDPRMSDPDHPMPFDGKRMIFGGFVPLPGTL
jgi:uncharacterized protein YbaA (DUF1428 family)